MYIQCGPKILGLIFFKKKSKTREEDSVFIKNKLHCHIYWLFRGLRVFEKLPKIPLSGHSLIRRLWLPGSQQRPQSGVLLTSLSTWGTENSLAEINLESTVGDKGL
jgi:hypothetical protein